MCKPSMPKAPPPPPPVQEVKEADTAALRKKKKQTLPGSMLTGAGGLTAGAFSTGGATLLGG